MRGYYKLIDAIDQSQTIAIARKSYGHVQNSHVKLMPGQKYRLENEDGTVDEVFIESLKRAKALKRKTQALLNTLHQHGVEYDEIPCKSCGGRVMKLSYSLIEIVVEEE